MVSGTLYVISTPIGNLEDISLRALRVLGEVSVIAAEDTRHTRKLLNHFQISTPAVAYHEHNKLLKLDSILEKLKAGQNIALVSDAGTPCISDPGWELVAACLKENIVVDALPGPSAPLQALVLSGFPVSEFTYAGFPPRKKSALQDFFSRLKLETTRRPLIFFEAPHRLVSTLETALETLGNRPVAVARELTKLHQTVRRENLSEALDHFRINEPRGEFTVVIAPYPENFEEKNEAQTNSDKFDPGLRLLELKKGGARAKEAVERVAAETGLNRRQLYDLWLADNEG